MVSEGSHVAWKVLDSKLLVVVFTSIITVGGMLAKDHYNAEKVEAVNAIRTADTEKEFDRLHEDDKSQKEQLLKMGENLRSVSETQKVMLSIQQTMTEDLRTIRSDVKDLSKSHVNG